MHFAFAFIFVHEFQSSTWMIANNFDCCSFKGHDMLAPFTAGWQSTDLHPLVIEKSEVCFDFFF